MHSHDRTMLSKLGFSDPDKKEERHDLACQYLAFNNSEALKKMYSAIIGIPVAGALVVFEKHLTKGQGQYKTTVGFLDAFIKVLPLVGTEHPIRTPLPSPIMRDEAWGRSIDYEATRVLHTSWKEKASTCDRKLLRGSAYFTSILEVKIKPVPVGDIIRQMRLYAEYEPDLGKVSRDVKYVSSDLAAGGWDQMERDDHPMQEWVDQCRLEGHPRLPDSFVRKSVEAVCSKAKMVVVVDFPLHSEDISTLKASGIYPIKLGAGFESYLESRAAAKPVEIVEL